MDTEAYKNSNTPVSYMEMNSTGLHLVGGDGLQVVVQVLLVPSDTKIAKLGNEGVFRINNMDVNNMVADFAMPVDTCQVPFTCGKMGLCMNQTCICPSGFSLKELNNNGCVPKQVLEETISLPSACTARGNVSEFNSSTFYVEMQNGIDYFVNHFTEPVKYGVTLSLCQNLCSQNCSCPGIFHKNSSGSCYLLDYNLGSFVLNSDAQGGPLGYIKAFLNVSTEHKKHSFPMSALVVIIMLSGLFMIITMVVLVIIWLRKKRPTGVNLDRWDSSSSAELEMISIPGLPRRFNNEELVAATENFKSQIGSGGFGTVYKGTILDNTVVAVKKITSLGDRGKMEFCAETATIGSIHHVNLVKLRGFCIHGRQCFLVYEYMNRGSLEKILFGNGPVLEWPKRYEIALGMARGLAYLHSGCEPKIIHCDIKPENILLHDDLQVKIADFGLAKLLYDEKSKLLTTLRGTRGYLAPEWLTSCGITDKTDVYSYGMVLLELVRGSRNCLFQSSGNENGEGNGSSFSSTNSELQVIYFPPIALEMHKLKRYMELTDPRLEGHVKSEEVEKLVKVALCCVHVVPTLRPSMSNVVAMLEGRLPVGEPRIEALEFLQFYGGKLNEASRKLRGRGSVEEEEVLSLMAEELTYL
ncbi:G-type lectin S-receptor-like serine/threonine-protein kinase At5g35370 [Rosa rugosa]|uniref:G-type lectin S-receptor-like serine/threonine-protein kinase At5g35370 n=1 Tax=Rosa rugosa TaxID=74645 RepID=UPI002B40A8B6|nr:G-type lectin S-receptor-like serine/threonine-protein kinase At5g35370 [Rosa rugosa]